MPTEHAQDDLSKMTKRVNRNSFEGLKDWQGRSRRSRRVFWWRVSNNKKGRPKRQSGPIRSTTCSTFFAGMSCILGGSDYSYRGPSKEWHSRQSLSCALNAITHTSWENFEVSGGKRKINEDFTCSAQAFPVSTGTHGFFGYIPMFFRDKPHGISVGSVLQLSYKS